MTVETILRWIAFFPVAVLMGIVGGAFFLLGGNYLVGYWRIPSILVIMMGSVAIPAGWMISGLNTAPEKSPLVKWILLSPLIILSILVAIVLFFMVFRSYPPEGILAGHSLSHSLSPYWQIILFSWGFIGGTFIMIEKSPSEITE
ncbi:MAG TPA: hypothetical protein VN256_20250 [Pyrinomonadaceae bacterium]|nr:hypothetical protein [Pyrinomonadaceae bacterium]